MWQSKELISEGSQAVRQKPPLPPGCQLLAHQNLSEIPVGHREKSAANLSHIDLSSAERPAHPQGCPDHFQAI